MVQPKSIIFIAVIWLVVLLSGCVDGKNTTAVPTTTIPAISINVTSVPSAIEPQIAPTSNGTQVKLDSKGGFTPDIRTIKAGDEVVWDNLGTVTVTLVSNDGLFDAKSLAYNQQYRYIFNEPGIYTFSIEKRELNGTIIVESQESPIPEPSATPPKEALSTALYVTARMKPMSNWSSGKETKYELNWLKVYILNQQNEILPIKAQIISGDQILEEKSFVLNKLDSSVEFSNEGNHFVRSTNVTLRLLIKDYPPIEYPFLTVDQIN